MKTIDQAAQECAEKLVAARNEDAKEWAQLDEITLTTPIIAAAMSEVCEPLEREAKAQGEHAVAMTEHAQSLQKELAEANAEVTRLNSGIVTRENVWETQNRELTQLRAKLVEAKAEVTRLKESYLKSQSLAAAMLAKSSDELTALRAEIDRLHNIWNNIEHIITERDQLRARVAELRRLLGEVYRNTNLRHHPELTGLADIVSNQLKP